MAEKVTTMVIKVNLQCPHCRKKIKKILCKFPQIRDQTYDEKQNTVTIKVVCCSPEKIRDKLCCKAGKIIINICIVVQPPSTPTQQPPRSPPRPPPPPPPPPVICVCLIGICCRPCCQGRFGGPCCHGYYCYGGCGRGYCVIHDDCFCEENPSACTIM